jgi:ethanolamine utilization protein EutP (predicted NTPase)
MINNKNESNEFDLQQRKSRPINFKYKQIMDTPGEGVLNAYQKSNLSEVQKDRIKEDKKKLGGS